MLASVHEVDVHEVDFARSGKQGSSLLEVGLLRARAQTKVGEVGDPKGLFRTPPSLRKNSLRFRNLSDIRKHSHNSPQYHKYSKTIPPIT